MFTKSQIDKAVPAALADAQERHGSPRDRGSADAYYGRPRSPHYFVGATHQSPMVNEVNMTAAEIAQYDIGFGSETDRKDYGFSPDILDLPDNDEPGYFDF